MNSVVPVRRFYKSVSVAAGGEGWQVLLDERPLKTPAKAELVIGSQPLADAIAAEWDAQQEKIRPDSMPLFKLLATAIDRVAPRRDEIVGATVKYAETDLLCYRAHEPPELVTLQSARWQPLLDWAARDLDAEFKVATGIIPVDQSPNALASLRSAVAELDAMELTGVSALAGATGSLVLALAIARGRIDATECGALALLDEEFQAEAWGEDPEARARWDRMRADIAETARFLDLIGQL